MWGVWFHHGNYLPASPRCYPCHSSVAATWQKLSPEKIGSTSEHCWRNAPQVNGCHCEPLVSHSLLLFSSPSLFPFSRVTVSNSLLSLYYRHPHPLPTSGTGHITWSSKTWKQNRWMKTFNSCHSHDPRAGAHIHHFVCLWQGSQLPPPAQETPGATDPGQPSHTPPIFTPHSDSMPPSD